jgi:serine/threonine protein kinase
MPENQPHSSESADLSQLKDSDWELVAEQIDVFILAWHQFQAGAASEPTLAAHFSSLEGTAREFLLGELIKVDLEQRWRQECHPRKLEIYLEEFPELGDLALLPVELIYEELQARLQVGDQVTEQEIRNRFPQQADRLCRLLAGLAVPGNATCTYYTPTDQHASDVRLIDRPFEGFQEGDQVDDFELLMRLGRGTFAQVFLARQRSLERIVALKISAPQGHEPQTLAQLNHENLVRVFDQRITVDPPLRLLYMEVVPGGTLREVVQRVQTGYSKTGYSKAGNSTMRVSQSQSYGSLTGQLLLDSIDEHLGSQGVVVPEHSQLRHWLASASWPLAVCQLGAQLAAGLAYAHDKGILHRDIKPANVLLTPEGAPKLADFNVSFLGGRADADPEEAFGGSLAYMAPEQLAACHNVLEGSPRLVKEASDIYAMGVLLWELLCGRRPMQESDHSLGTLAQLQQMIDQRRQADWTTLIGQLPADCPAGLRDVLLRCLQPHPADRYDSARELAAALQLCLHPRCWLLLKSPTSIPARMSLRWPIASMIAVALLPNMAAGWFNLTYNQMAIIERLPESLSNLLPRFEKIYWSINSIVFPLGIAVVLWAALQIRRQLQPDRHSGQYEMGTRAMLRFGQFVTRVMLILWALSGLAFPLLLSWGQPIGKTAAFYTHFFLSMALCGLVASSYPYFGLTRLAVCWYLPALVRAGIVSGPAMADLRSLRRSNRIYLALSGLVPLLAMMLLVLFRDGLWRVQLAVSAGGLVGFGIIFLLERMIDRDLSALEHIATPRTD